MSLKDRLGNQTKTTLKIEKKEVEPNYYQTSEISQAINSLGEIDTLFADNEINSISVYGAKNVFIERKGKKSKISLTFRDNVRLENIIRKNAQFHGLEFDKNHPYVEFNHRPGINVTATLPPLSSSAVMIIKCYNDKYANLKTLTECQVLSKEMALFVEALASLKINIIIAGEKNTLKTTLLSAIAKKVPQNNNAVVIDYSNELNFNNNNIVTYDFKNYKNDELIEQILFSNPDKIFLNDCNDLSIFEKYTSGAYRGVCATYCCENPLDVLQDIYLKKADVVIFVERKESKRLISSVSIVNVSELEDIFRLNENFKHNSTGVIPDFYDEIEQTKLPISNAIFEENYKHTYCKAIENDVLANALKKNLNPDILKKFKKDLNVNETPKITQTEPKTQDIDTENALESNINEQTL